MTFSPFVVLVFSFFRFNLNTFVFDTFSAIATLIAPTPLEWGGTITQMGFFCTVNFRRSIYSS